MDGFFHIQSGYGWLGFFFFLLSGYLFIGLLDEESDGGS